MRGNFALLRVGRGSYPRAEMWEFPPATRNPGVMHRVELRAGVTLNELRPRIWWGGGKLHLKLGAFMGGSVK
jgi:hypothetical protein